MACSTCDDYEFVDDPAGGPVKVACPDCRARRDTPNRFCLQHRTTLLQDGRCWRCRKTARLEEVLFEIAHETGLTVDEIRKATDDDVEVAA